MFSYLRPNNKRSAIPPATSPSSSASSARYYHGQTSLPSQTNTHDRSPRHSQKSSTLESLPLSTDPPSLPPISRVSSQSPRTESKEQEVDPEEARYSSPNKAEDISPEAQFTPSRHDLDTSQNPPNAVGVSANMPTEAMRPDKPSLPPERRKRPIDIKYESMRSYTEPPFRQSIAIPAENSTFLPPPTHPPPPPPNATDAQSRAHLPYSQSQTRKPSAKPSSRPVQSPSQPHRPNRSYISRFQPPPRQRPIPHKAAQVEPPSTESTSNHDRLSKTKLNLLNPMSLLARRRSHQAIAAVFSQGSDPPGLRLPDKDPRIRGNVVHDFSTPRPKTGVQVDEAPPAWAKGKENRRPISGSKADFKSSDVHDDGSHSDSEREHTPVFKEHFDDGVGSAQDGPAQKRSAAFLYQVSLQEAQPQPHPSSLPAFARALPPSFSSSIDRSRQTASPPAKEPLEVLVETPDKDQSSAQHSPPLSSSKPKSQASSVTDAPLGSPKRFTSNASRFSFDLAGVGSAAQEKLLEERHRENAKRKKQNTAKSDQDSEEDEEEYIDNYDDINDDDALEEDIPGVDANSHIDHSTMQAHPPVSDLAMEDCDLMLPQTLAIDGPTQNLTEMFNFVSPNKSSFESITSPASTNLTSLGTPRDSQGQPVGFAISQSSPDFAHLQCEALAQKDGSRPKSAPANDLAPNSQDLLLSLGISSSRNPDHDDDDLYFDDGMIEDLGDVSEHAFDESVFDDNSNGLYGLPLRDRTLIPMSQPEENPADDDTPRPLNISSLAPQDTVVEKNRKMASSPHRSLSSDGMTAELRDALTDLNQPNRRTFSHTAGLTQDNLAAYNENALSSKTILGSLFDFDKAQPPRPVIDDGIANQSINPQHKHDSDQGLAGLPTFNDYEDDAEDDPIVAAANAEALENDDDGFYGQEFGFFAKASGSSDAAEYSNGGYFGPRALEGIYRSHSGRVQEPALTPITERSEWSNRNSAISLAMYGGHPLSAPPMTSPQFADMQLDDMNMQLAMLKQLRRGAWGGSDASLHSSNNSQNSGSPMTYLPNGVANQSFIHPSGSSINLPFAGGASDQNLASSLHSSNNGHASSNGSGGYSPSNDSPTITSTAPPSLGLTIGSPPLHNQTVFPPPATVPTETSPVKWNSKNGWAPGHSRNSSGAEISYVKESDEEGGRWWLERKRVGETGEVEILGRQLVEGGRI